MITETDLTGNRATAPEGKRLAAKRRNVVDPLALTAGDLVVHDQHGIGRFVEMTERIVGGARREYLVLEYASSKRGGGSDRLYVPMDSLDQLSRYVGGEAPTLCSLGGSDWANTKTKARKAVREIAAELVALYAKRQAAPGHAFAPDTPWQAEMEDAFGFTETVDQLTAITEVKADMEKPVPMDRVICGDVGYGKTEIAVRAAFKAVQDGKQVAVLVPTTLLADQHLQTFTERMAGFPVTVKGLSRFTDPAESRAVLEGMADGSVDIVIGTHRLLQTGVTWKDLGLVVVDEEQRFGVEHKEHIKSLRTHVDVLTMSATPIPRTLEMSLAGIREMSTILTPPEERYPVLTYVGPHDDKQVAAALRRELLRDGQVVLHPQPGQLHRPGRGGRVRALVPEARVVVAHGQMPEEHAGEHGRGLLEPRVRHPGVHHDRRDRPGHLQRQHVDRRARRHVRAVAAAPAARPGGPQPGAWLRLLPVSARGAADRDRLRPAGDDRPEQRAGRGHGGGDEGPRDPRRRQRAGRRAVRARRRRRLRPVRAAGRRGRRGVPRGGRRRKPLRPPEEPKDVRIDLPVDAHLPPDYIGSDRLRLEAYRRLAAAADDAAVDAVVDELIDRYGPLPEPAQRLVAVARLRLLCRSYGITEISAVSESTLRIVAADAAGLPATAAQAACTRVRTTAPPPRRCRCRSRGRVPASGRRGSATSNWCRWWPV